MLAEDIDHVRHGFDSSVDHCQYRFLVRRSSNWRPNLQWAVSVFANTITPVVCRSSLWTTPGRPPRVRHRKLLDDLFGNATPAH